MLSLISLSVKNYSQDVNIKNNEKAGIDSVAVLFLTDVSDNSPIQSGLIYPESLEKFKEHMISISLEYDSSGHTNAMMLLPADSLRSMTPAQVWDNMNRMKHYLNVQKLNTTWHIVKTEIENNIAFVTYDIKDGEQKVMKLKKDENKWKVILSGKSIF
jgi:uncharacterized protein (DUF1919 family)